MYRVTLYSHSRVAGLSRKGIRRQIQQSGVEAAGNSQDAVMCPPWTRPRCVKGPLCNAFRGGCGARLAAEAAPAGVRLRTRRSHPNPKWPSEIQYFLLSCVVGVLRSTLMVCYKVIIMYKRASRMYSKLRGAGKVPKLRGRNPGLAPAQPQRPIAPMDPIPFVTPIVGACPICGVRFIKRKLMKHMRRHR